MNQLTRQATRLILFFLVAAQATFLITYADAGQGQIRHLSFRLTGGWGSTIPVGDINTQLGSVNNNAAFVYWRQNDPSRVIGSIEIFDDQIRLPEWEAELRFVLSSSFGVGLATSMPYNKTTESSVRYLIIENEDTQIIDYTYSPTISVGPVLKFSLFYSLFEGQRLSTSLAAGAGYYSVRIKEYFGLGVIGPLGDYDTVDRDYSCRPAFPIGFHAGFSFSYKFARRLFLVLEGQWRYADFHKFTGTSQEVHNRWTSGGQLVQTDTNQRKGTLYYFTMEDLYLGARYADLRVWETIPDVSPFFIDDVRKSRLDLSRFSLRIGFELRLF